jgi:hypothetical protein
VAHSVLSGLLLWPGTAVDGGVRNASKRFFHDRVTFMGKLIGISPKAPLLAVPAPITLGRRRSPFRLVVLMGADRALCAGPTAARQRVLVADD